MKGQLVSPMSCSLVACFLFCGVASAFRPTSLSTQYRPRGGYYTVHQYSPRRSLSPIADYVESSGNRGSISSRVELPPVMKEMVNERREYELNLGKAMDTLRTDYPRFLTTLPDFTIYHDEISVVDPSGLQLKSLGSYKSSIRILQSIIGVFYNTEKSSIYYRMVNDYSTIRISFNLILCPKFVGNRRNAVYIDGISVYKVDCRGKIVEHRVETLLMNNIPVRPPYGVLTELLKPISSLQGGPAAGVPAGGFGLSSLVR